jgi:thiamine phosphate synthase YjbQ (UPF0047 family)
MTTQLATRVMRARRESICPTCRRVIRVGDQIAKAGTWQHVEHITARQREADRAILLAALEALDASNRETA